MVKFSKNFGPRKIQFFSTNISNWAQKWHFWGFSEKNAQFWKNFGVDFIIKNLIFTPFWGSAQREIFKFFFDLGGVILFGRSKSTLRGGYIIWVGILFGGYIVLGFIWGLFGVEVRILGDFEVCVSNSPRSWNEGKNRISSKILPRAVLQSRQPAFLTHGRCLGALPFIFFAFFVNTNEKHFMSVFAKHISTQCHQI